MSKFKTKTIVKDIRGAEVKAEDGKLLTFGDVAVTALLSAKSTDDQAKKLERFKLAQAFASGDEIELKATDVVAVMTAVSDVYGPLVVGRMAEFLGEI